MRETKIAVIILFILIITVTANAVYIKTVTDDLTEKLKNIDIYSANAYENFLNAEKFFRKHEKFISLSVSHEDLSNIEDSFSELIGASLVGKISEMSIIKSRLEDTILHLGRLSGFNIDSIL